VADVANDPILAPFRGKIANLDQLAPVIQSTLAARPGQGIRAIDAAVVDGLSIRVLPDRGFDIGMAWFAGVPLAWLPEVGERPHSPPSRGWRGSTASAAGS
jgi:hypothetical protein